MDNNYKIAVACPQCGGALYSARFDSVSMRGRQEQFFDNMAKCIICRRHWESNGNGVLQEWPDRSKIGMAGVREINEIKYKKEEQKHVDSRLRILIGEMAI